MMDGVSLVGARIAPTEIQRAGATSHTQEPSVGAADGPSFGQVLEQVSRDASQALRGAEAVSISALQGGASTIEVVEAIKSAEHALHTATAVRDKLVQAYQEVSRMAI